MVNWEIKILSYSHFNNNYIDVNINIISDNYRLKC